LGGGAAIGQAAASVNPVVRLTDTFKLENRAMMMGVALLAGGVAGHYWPEIRYAVYFGACENVPSNARLK
jgi:hypothetical protein